MSNSEFQKVFMVLTRRQAEKLAEILEFTNDEGSAHEGWASAELVSLREIVRDSLFPRVP